MRDEFDRLEMELERLGRALSYPAPPSLAAAVRERLEGQRSPAPYLPRRWALAAAAAALVAALALLLGAWAPGREAVADFFDRIHIFQTEKSPAGLPREIEGTPATRQQAEAALGYALKEPAYPEDLALRRILLQRFPGFAAAVLLYEDTSGRGFALFETDGVVGKGLPSGATAQSVSGFGGEAFWLEGLRIVQYHDEQGNLIQESRRATDANTLIWDEGGFVFRLEGELSQEEAVRIAQSLR